MSLAHLKNIEYSIAGKKLYSGIELKINPGEKIALLGPNGAGKTTLLNIISGKIAPDNGIIDMHERIKYGYLDQHLVIDKDIIVGKFLKEAYADLYELEAEMTKIYADMEAEYSEKKLLRALSIQDMLDAQDFDSIEKKVGQLVNGLGIGLDKLDLKIDDLSGGQKAKIILAKLLLTKKDFLILDEPTNFLDISQVNWLSDFLKNSNITYILVSHDIDFINKTCNIIYSLKNTNLIRFVGNYDEFVEYEEVMNENYDRQVKQQKQQIKKLETYIAKNSARASTAKSAQSRAKQLTKMDKLEDRKELQKPNFAFKYKRPASTIILNCNDLEIGYDKRLVEKLNIKIRDGEKMLISGKNGVGKTTFLNTISGALDKLGGNFEIGEGVSIMYFKQLEKIEPISAVSYIRSHNPNLGDNEARSLLAKFAIKGKLMSQPMTTLSGGEQTKVRLANLNVQPCGLLLLDEPTNNIDVLAKEALLEAIEAFEGTVIMTTHDINFSTNWAQKILELK
ncbi:ATP-binding cassette domain-containing protein [Spiroplasma endosymbiont of Anurida maritima]|uniref:ABC-F family ATP-binding cassette domain-containing protein n=1 Tax=Spiroplasma endosymbiont of Anurida maritima TaxID=2967972 RepID=UPI0036D3F48B